MTRIDRSVNKIVNSVIRIVRSVNKIVNLVTGIVRSVKKIDNSVKKTDRLRIKTAGKAGR